MEENKNTVQVSVMVAIYNQKDYIRQTLEPIFKQKTNFDFEVLLGDDGSNDGTYEILLEYQNRYPGKCCVIRNPREENILNLNGRVSLNRLNLLKHAKGKYIIFLDGDDYWIDDHKLQKQYDLLENNPDCIACGHPVIMKWEEEDWGDNRKPDRLLVNLGENVRKIDTRLYLTRYYLHIDSMLYRNVIRAEDVPNFPCGFDDNTVAIQYFTRESKLLYIPDPMVAYRQLPQSTWNKSVEFEKNYIELINFYLVNRINTKFNILLF